MTTGPGGSSSTGKRRRIPPDERRAEITAVARRVFVRDGLAARTKDIAAEAGVDSALLYYYFKSKAELFEASVLEPLTVLVDQMRQGSRELANTTSDHERYALLRRRHNEMTTILTELVPLLGIALFADPTHGRKFYQDRLAPVLADIASATEKGMAGWSRPGLTARDLVWSIFGAHLARGIDAVLGEEHDLEAGDRLGDLFWHAMIDPRRTADDAQPPAPSTSAQSHGSRL
jgi:AcrR family transcriptional regulator